MRMMIVFKKAYPVRHIGHLDLMRTMQRGLRRSGVPVRYSQGYNPHIKLSFASPLSVGIVGEREIMDVPVDGEYAADVFRERFSRAMPECLRIVDARAIGDTFPTLMGLAAGSRYRIGPEIEPGVIAGAVKQLLAADAYMALRKTKSGEAMCDIRPYIHALDVNGATLTLTALNLQSGSLKPKDLMRALFAIADIEPCYYTVTREAILAKDAQGKLVPLEVISHE